MRNPLSLLVGTAPTRIAGLVFGPALLLTGCEILGDIADKADEPIDFPIPIDVPAGAIDVDTPVGQAEGGLCADEDANSCKIVAAMEKKETGSVSDPAAIPDEFDESITIEDDMGNALPDPDCPGLQEDPPDPSACDDWVVDVEEWLNSEEVGIFSELEFAQVIPMNLSEEIEVKDESAIEKVSIASLGIGWADNTITFDMPDFEFYLSREELEEDADAKALIADAESGLEKIGSIKGQAAETDGDAEIEWVEGGEEAFNEALRSRVFSLVIALPAEVSFELGRTDEGKLKKPGGEAELSFIAEFVFTVVPTELAGEAKEKYENGELGDAVSDIQNLSDE